MRVFEEKRKNFKFLKGNRIYYIHIWDYKIKSFTNPYTKPIFTQILGRVMLDSLRS